MGDTLTGDAADAYLTVWLEQDGRPLDAARLRRDALRARGSRQALGRLRLAAVRLRARPAGLSPAARVPRCRQRRRVRLSQARCRPGGVSPGRPPRRPAARLTSRLGGC